VLSGAAANELSGLAGNDRLLGAAGDNHLFGSDGDDMLTGVCSTKSRFPSFFRAFRRSPRR
jgi:Ca2+-binding RTX toxin-like protein